MASLYEKQIAAASELVIPPFEGTPPAPTQSSADVVQAGIDQRMKAARRNGLNKTVFAGKAAA